MGYVDMRPWKILIFSLVVAYCCPLFVLFVCQPILGVMGNGVDNIFLAALKTVYSLLLSSMFDGPLFVLIALISFWADVSRFIVRASIILVSSTVNFMFCDDLIDSVGILDTLWTFGLDSGRAKIAISIFSTLFVIILTSQMGLRPRSIDTESSP